MPRTIRVLPIATMAIAAAALSVALGSSNALATVDPGTPGKDVHFGQDNDNASNPFIQPPGVNVTLHMDNTDVMFGRDNDDLLVGKKGSDTLLGGSGSDILIGGPDQGSAPVSDVMVADKGDDVSIWSPRDGNDAFAGDEGEDTAIFAPLVTNRDGSLRLDSWESRTIPRVTIDRAGAFCAPSSTCRRRSSWAPSTSSGTPSTAPQLRACSSRTSSRCCARAGKRARSWLPTCASPTPG